MNNLLKTLTLSTLLLPFYFSQAQNSTEAIQYMNDITEKAFELEDETWDYLKAVTRGKKASKVEDKRRELVKAIKLAQLAIARKKDFKGDAGFKDAIVDYLALRHTVLKEDYDEILDMEAIAEQSYDAMEAYLLAQEKASDKLDSAFDIMTNAQKVFAEKYGIKLTDSRDKKAMKIQKASQTLEYYNDIYLIFFKSYKQEVYVIDAMNRGDISSIEQNNNTLLTFSKEGLDQLKRIRAYDGDNSLVLSGRKILEFYKNEAENEFKLVSDFYLKKDEFEKINNLIQSKSKKERTQADIDNYNKAADEYNVASEKFNAVMKTSDQNRSKFLNNWNKTVESFLSKHS